jgi:hypothetical protein
MGVAKGATGARLDTRTGGEPGSGGGEGGAGGGLQRVSNRR